MLRRLISCALSFCVILSLGACSDGGGILPPAGDVTGRVQYGGAPQSGASVYLLRQLGIPFAPAAVLMDSTRSDAGGWFAFGGLADGDYAVYAGVWNAGGGFRLVSPVSDEFEAGSKSSGADLELIQVVAAGGVKGTVIEMAGQPAAPSADANVTLYRYEGGDKVPAATTKTDAAGSYAFAGVATGNYVVYVAKLSGLDSPYPSYMTGESDIVFCDGTAVTDAPEVVISDIQVDKPALYLYPERTTDFDVRLRLGRGVRLTASEPEYGDGWQVRVEPTGLIDGRWDYLFYEVGMAGRPQVPHGWCLRGDRLDAGLRRVTAALGLNEAESEACVEYWLDRLPRRAWYTVCPLVDDELDGLVALDITPAPDTIRRFWLLFEGADAPRELPAPTLAPFVRRGVVAVEWGGALAP